MKLSKFTTLASTAMVAALAATLSTSPAQAMETWQFALEEPQGQPQFAYAEKFAERMEELSGGQIAVGIYPYGTIGTSADLTELAQSGAIQLAFASPGHFGSVVPEVQVFSVPYLLSQHNDVNAKVLSESPVIYEDLQQHINERHLQLLTMWAGGEMVWTSNKEIRSPEDFDGVRMRVMVSPMLVATYEAFGAEPTPLPYGEVYSGLQLGTIDAQVNPLYAIRDMNFYEVQDYMTFPGENQYTAMVIANKAWYDGLEEEQREWLTQAAREATQHHFDNISEINEDHLQAIREDDPDINVVELSAEERDQFAARADAVREKFMELAGDSGRAILEGLDEEFKRVEEEMGH